MKIKNNIILLGALSLLTACHDELTAPTYTVGEAVNAISLQAGISEGGEGEGEGVATRAVDGNHAGNANGGAHTNFTNGTQLRLRVDGTWHSSTVTKTTTATTGVATGADYKHNEVTFSTTSNPVEQLYWDDYGTADPDNTAGRTAGLTIYGAAVDGVATAPTISSWTAQAWNVGSVSAGVIDQTGGWSTKDLLTSNNIQVVDAGKPYATDGTYKFQNYIDDLKNGTTTASNLLEFTHAMTKITVNLTAGEGFPGWSSSAPNGGKFETEPSVTLKDFYYTGNVSVEAKTSNATTSSKANINMHLTATAVNQHTATLDALVFPGNTFSATIGASPEYKPTSATNILELNADGNIYKVTAAQLVKAMNAAGTTGSVNGTLLQGKNYILNITVNKTKIEVTATIKDWEDVNTEDALPKINVTATYGYTAGAMTSSSAFTNNYDLFRSTTKATGYDEDADNSNGINPAARYTSSAWNKTIYWPNHQTHYFFRGVYPQIETAATGVTLANEAVTTVSSNDVIAVANATYTSATYPSDLAIAIPRNTDGTLDETCKETGHTATEGICATEGVINMNFEYAMSKVEVRLKSTATTNHGDIAMTKDNTKVEIIDGYNKARIKLSDGLHDTYADADKGDYKLSNLTTSETGFLVTTRDAVVPQVIGNDVIFRITVTTDNNGTPDDTSDDKTDVYECKVNLIKVKDTTTPVTEWEHGKHYIYELDVNKTAVNVVATIKDWVTVTADDQVWF